MPALFRPVLLLPEFFFFSRPMAFRGMKKVIRPGALLFRKCPSGLPKRILQHRMPPRRVEQSNANGMLDERRHARRLSRADKFADGYEPDRPVA